jgi:hypothetical protein
LVLKVLRGARFARLDTGVRWLHPHGWGKCVRQDIIAPQVQSGRSRFHVLQGLIEAVAVLRINQNVAFVMQAFIVLSPVQMAPSVHKGSFALKAWSCRFLVQLVLSAQSSGLRIPQSALAVLLVIFATKQRSQPLQDHAENRFSAFRALLPRRHRPIFVQQEHIVLKALHFRFLVQLEHSTVKTIQ